MIKDPPSKKVDFWVTLKQEIVPEVFYCNKIILISSVGI